MTESVSPHFTYFATCPKGLEDLLSAELAGLGGQSLKTTVAGVRFEGDLAHAYRACLHSRLANRVLLYLSDPTAAPLVNCELDLYQAVKDLSWWQHIPVDATIAVDFTGTNKAVNNTLYGAVRVKDAIVDAMREHSGVRPNVDRTNPDLRINARLAKDRLYISLDLSGDSLHRRGYRAAKGAAPLKENLAAGILMRAGWPGIAEAGGSLIDPMCGSGTLLIEAALMAADIAPGLTRSKFGFARWLLHDESLWESERQAAQAHAAVARRREKPLILGCDQDATVLRYAKHNVENAGLADWITLERRPVEQFAVPKVLSETPGLIICNPPYGERMGELAELEGTYSTLAAVTKEHCPGWSLAVFTGNTELARQMRLRPERKNRFFNGPIASELLVYRLLAADQATLRRDKPQAENLSEGATMVANRLRKNRTRLSKWLASADTNCYRLYDADMPEYAVAVDVYGDLLHVQEYAAPKSVAERDAQKRLREVLQALAVVFDTEVDSIAVKTRQRQRGTEQYRPMASTKDFTQVHEGRARFWVNMTDYLDTGLFLDHRPLRQIIAQEARGKRFLNLFCYTASATVHAALAGASQSVSVDMSRTYLDWAARNFELNHIQAKKHELVQADCLTWLDRCRTGFDLILLDPPTFSNSKRMTGVLDVQRDHVALVQRCMELLAPGGRLYFSTNLRNFKIDPSLKEGYALTDISAQTIDADFARNQKIHRCFLIQHPSVAND